MNIKQDHEVCWKKDNQWQVKSQCSEQESISQKANIRESGYFPNILSEQQQCTAYQNMFEEVGENHRSLSQMIQELKKHNIFYNSNYEQLIDSKFSQNNLRIESIEHTKHFQIVRLKVSLGCFSHSLTLYNTFSASIFSEVELFYSNNMTNIYRFKNNQTLFIAKSLGLLISEKKSLDIKNQTFLSIIKEYFLTKIMSVLQIGPKLCEQFGFDLFVSLNDVFFCLESCLTADQKIFTRSDSLTLKRSLKQMHMLSILHRDIKPQNIMYSPSYKKYVFIDFGISQSRKQDYHQLVYANFAGTYNYTTKEMKRLFETHQSSWVNLHWNDAYGLELSLKQLDNTAIISQLIENQYYENFHDTFLDDFLIEVKIKSLLYFGNLDHLTLCNLFQEVKPQFYASIMKFLYQIPLTEEIRKIYQEFIEEHVKKWKQFQDLKKILDQKIYVECYKGKREYESIEQRNNIKTINQFFEQIQFSHNSKNLFRKFSAKWLQYFLLTENLNQLKPDRYQFHLIESINFKRIEAKIPIETKLSACKKYFKLNEIKNQSEWQVIKINQIFQLFFHHVLMNMKITQKILHIETYITALDNYFILSKNIDFKVLVSTHELIEVIFNHQNLSSLQKMELTFLINLSYGFIFQRIQKIKFRSFFHQTNQLINQKVNIQASKKQNMSNSEAQIYEIYVESLNYFSQKINTSTKQNFNKLFKKLNGVKASSQRFPQILNFIRYKILVQTETFDSISEKKQLEEMILEEMERSNEINCLLVHLILFYFKIKSVKNVKKLMEIYDSCISINELYRRDFGSIRFFVQLAMKYEQISGQFGMQFQNSYNEEDSLLIDEKNFVKFHSQFQNSLLLYDLSQELNMSSQYTFIENNELITQKIDQSFRFYEDSQPKFSLQSQKNHLYFQFLIRVIKIESFELARQQEIQLCECQEWKIYPMTKSFHEIMKMDRSNFIEQDHVMLLYFDIIQLKYQDKTTCGRRILEYLLKNNNIISLIFSYQNFVEKSYIYKAFSLFLNVLNDENDISLLKEGVNFVYLKIGKKLYIENLFPMFNQIMTQSLIKLRMFQQLLNGILDSSKFYMNHPSNSNTLEFTRFYSQIINDIICCDKNNQFDTHLMSFLSTIDLKKNPVFAIFLIFCIKSQNRRRILKMIVQNFQHLWYKGKYFILSRFYKELLKLKEFPSDKKRKYLMRKDLKYPSAFMKDLTEMKCHLNCENHLVNFRGIFNQILSKKIIKLGKCCEVYSPKKQLHHFSQILNHLTLDLHQ